MDCCGDSTGALIREYVEAYEGGRSAPDLAQEAKFEGLIQHLSKCRECRRAWQKKILAADERRLEGLADLLAEEWRVRSAGPTGALSSTEAPSDLGQAVRSIRKGARRSRTESVPAAPAFWAAGRFKLAAGGGGVTFRTETNTLPSESTIGIPAGTALGETAMTLHLRGPEGVMSRRRVTFLLVGKDGGETRYPARESEAGVYRVVLPVSAENATEYLLRLEVRT